MTWNYSGDPTTSDLDEIRALVQDVDSAFPLLQDEEINWLLTKWSPVYGSNEMVAAVAAALIARKFAGLVSVSADGVEVDVSELTERYTAMAADLRAEYAQLSDTGEVDTTNLMTDTSVDPSIMPLSFARGMHDNPAAGLQDFGGWWPPVWAMPYPLVAGADG